MIGKGIKTGKHAHAAFVWSSAFRRFGLVSARNRLKAELQTGPGQFCIPYLCQSFPCLHPAINSGPREQRGRAAGLREQNGFAALDEKLGTAEGAGERGQRLDGRRQLRQRIARELV